MSDDPEIDPVREKIGEVIQKNPPPGVLADGAILTGWVVVAEWMDPDGELYLSQLYDKRTTVWKRDGMLGYVMEEFGTLDKSEDE